MDLAYTQGLKNKRKLCGTARIRTAVQESQTLEDRPGYPTVPWIATSNVAEVLKSFLPRPRSPET